MTGGGEAPSMMEKMHPSFTPAVRKRLQHLLREAVLTDGAHHKQWFLERIALELWVELPPHENGVCP